MRKVMNGNNKKYDYSDHNAFLHSGGKVTYFFFSNFAIALMLFVLHIPRMMSR